MAAVLIRGTCDGAEQADFSLSGFVFHVDGGSSFIASVASPLRASLDDPCDPSTCSSVCGAEVKMSKVTLKNCCTVSVRFGTTRGRWARCDNSCILLEFPTLHKQLMSVLRKSDWKTAETIDTFCDIIVFKCDLPFDGFTRWTPAAATLASSLHILSSPFGIFAPDVFTSTVCSGIVSSIISDNGLFLSDARCLPGSAGGVVVTPSNGHLVGLSLGSLQRRNEQNVDIHVCMGAQLLLRALVISVQHAVRVGMWPSLAHPFALAPAPHSRMPGEPVSLDMHGMAVSDCVSLGSDACVGDACLPHEARPVTTASVAAASMTAASRAVVLLMAGTMWASGVIIDRCSY